MKQYDNVILVTGGAGFIGSAFLRMLVPRYPEWFFINIDALTYAGDLKKVETIKDHENYIFVHGNICDYKLVESLFDRYSVNIVVNFAAESHVDNSLENPNLFMESNVRGVLNLLNVSRTKWSDVSDKSKHRKMRFIQISTDEVYGSLDYVKASWTEDSPILPNSPYSASKASAELFVRSYVNSFKFPAIITRSSNNFGPFQNREKLIPKLINSLLHNRTLPIYGNGMNIRDWIYVDDNIEAILCIILTGELGQIYNIGGGNELSNLDLAKKLISLFPESKSTVEFINDRPGHDFRYSVNYGKILKLGWKLNQGFETGLKKTIEFYVKKVD